LEVEVRKSELQDQDRLFSVGGRLTGILLLAVIVFVCSGCSLLEIRKQSRAMGSVRSIQGTVKRSADRRGQIYVQLFQGGHSTLRLMYQGAAGSDGSYRLWCPPGTYYVIAFIDANNDGTLQKDEPWNYHGAPTAIHVAGDKNISLERLTLYDQSPVLDTSAVDVQLTPIYESVGKVVTLQDPLFTPENYAMGMWRPADFISKIGGGLLFLQEFEPRKIPVLFVHGINGGPTGFREVIEHLDRTSYQPWVLYYPSGVRLNIISDFFESVIVAVQDRYGFEKFAMVGHSMGGLVVRSIVKKYLEKHPDRADNIAFVMTINAPLSGIPSAEFGAKSPIPVQSWLDIIPGSAFLQEINEWPWPSPIPSYLIFSFGQGDGDGVVTLSQQLPLKPQQEALHVYGFDDTHVGTLQDPSFLQVFRSILSRRATMKRNVDTVESD
jgi:pimeloyl-ACP methyl ester carboxylesterase